MALDGNGRPSDQALLAAMKRDMDEQISRLNDNRIFLIAVVDELQQEIFDLNNRLDAAQQPESVPAPTQSDTAE